MTQIRITGGQILLVNFLDHMGLGQAQQFVIAFDEQFAARPGEIDEAPLRPAAVVFLGQLVLLDHGAHRAVQDQDAPGHQVAQQQFGSGGDFRLHRHIF